MKKVSYDELVKISDFIASCNNLINGKFILADVKIVQVLNVIASSQELYTFVSECLIGFNFQKELHKAEVKNRFNGGIFNMPEENSKIVAMTFCLLVEFDTKRIDFYQFINENFSSVNGGTEYKNFSQTVLVPMRDIVASYFGLSTENNDKILEENTENSKIVEEEQIEKDEEIEQQPKEADIFEDIDRVVKHIEGNIVNEKLKPHEKENLTYILDGIIYSLKYKDMRLIASFVVAIEPYYEKLKNTKLLIQELNQCIEKYYSK